MTNFMVYKSRIIDAMQPNSPTAKIALTPIFSLVGRCSFQITKRGSAKIEKSDKILNEAVATKLALMLRQWPLVTKGFQIISRGVHAKASTNVSRK